MDKLLKVIVDELEKKQADDIEIIDFKNINPFNDYFVICSARNHRLAMSLVKAIKDEVYKNGFEIKAIEGDESSDWVLIDAYDVVVHIFVGESRYVYQLEKLWGDLPRI